MKTKFALPALLLAAFVTMTPRLVNAQDYYEWTDEEGTVHFTDSLGQVPPKYRKQFKSDNADRQKPAGEPAPKQGTSAGSPAATAGAGASGGAAAGNTANQAPAARRIEVPYIPNEGSAKRIIIPVRFNDRVTAQLALDTGAPGLVICHELAEKLGVFSRDKGTLIIWTGGIGGEVPAVRTILDTIAVDQARTSFVPTTITDHMSDAFEGLLGMDFMSNYSIQIDSARKVVVFQERPPEPNAPGGHDEEWWRTNFREFGGAKTEWQRFAAALEQEIRASHESAGARIDELKRYREFAVFQAREADQLYERLDRIARQYAVPRAWR